MYHTNVSTFVAQILPPLGMFEENITTLVKNKMTINEWQSLYDSVTDDFVEERQEKNHVSIREYWNEKIETVRDAF